jgi:hypothetical protein
MESQTYLMVNTETNVCENIIAWDGNLSTWTPPENMLMLMNAQTPARIWEINTDQNSYSLKVVNGVGQIGFTWDGSYLTTNEPMPVIHVPTTPV